MASGYPAVNTQLDRNAHNARVCYAFLQVLCHTQPCVADEFSAATS
jgi:hypothetical protein